MSHRRGVGAALLATSVIWIVAVADPGKVTAAPTRALDPASASVEAPADDTVQLAKDLGIPLDELREEIRLQDAMDEIPFEELDPGYAEDGSVLGSDFQIWYRSAAPTTEPLLAALRAARR